MNELNFEYHKNSNKKGITYLQSVKGSLERLETFTNYRNRFEKNNTIYGERFQGHCQPRTDWCWFELLVGADLLPSTGFKVNFLVK